MAKSTNLLSRLISENRVKKVTSIGNSARTRFNSKADKKMGKKKSRGQG